MRERRRVALIARQLMLARHARREAMGVLAEALSEERRSADLSARSVALASEYGAVRRVETAIDLQTNTSFAASLAQLAQQAEQARQDASDQVRWQAQALARAEHRKSALEERAKDAWRALEAVDERREQDAALAVARKLQSSSHDTGSGAETPQPARSKRTRP